MMMMMMIYNEMNVCDVRMMMRLKYKIVHICPFQSVQLLQFNLHCLSIHRIYHLKHVTMRQETQTMQSLIFVINDLFYILATQFSLYLSLLYVEEQRNVI